MVPSWWCVTIYYIQANSSKKTIVPEQSGVAKEEFGSLFTRRGKSPLWHGSSDLV
jgi:hypothetical protein